MHDCDVVVVGAGLAGLTAARELTGAGLDVRVLEAEDVQHGDVGGLDQQDRLAGGTQQLSTRIADQSGKRAAAEVMRSEGSALAMAAGARAAQAARVVPG